MVWGVNPPKGFGDYWPHGDYVGWKEALLDYYNTKMSAEEKAAMGMEERILYSPFTNKFFRDKGPLKPVECPTEYRTKRTHESLASLIDTTYGILAVDEPLKDIIERLEPGVHQFCPIRLTMPRGKQYPVPYFAMRIGRFLDSLEPEQSDAAALGIRKSPQGDTYYPYWHGKKFYGGIAFSEKMFGGSHIWRERKINRIPYFLSDTLKAAIDEAGLRMPKFYKMKVV